MKFDITIVGSGLVGAILACAFKSQELKIALIDKSSLNVKNLGLQDSLDSRALVLSLSSIECLKTLGLWPKIVEYTSVVQTVHTSKQGHFGVSKISAAEYKLPALGYVVDADFLNIALNQAIETLPNVKIFRPTEIIDLKKKEPDQSWKIKLSHNLNNMEFLESKLLVAADGAESMMRKNQGINVKIHDYQQTAIVVNIALKQPHHGVAYERFLENGSIAMLPFGEKKVKCVWVVPNNQLNFVETLSDSEFLAKIQGQFGYRLGFLKQFGKRYFYPLKKMSAETVYGDRLVLIGNAANTIHPIAAQGFNLGLRDAATLAEILVQAQRMNQDLGSVEVLRTYANRRVTDHQDIRYFTDSLAESPVFQWLGILASEWVMPVKHAIAARGLGQQQRLPKLCRGVALT